MRWNSKLLPSIRMRGLETFFRILRCVRFLRQVTPWTTQLSSGVPQSAKRLTWTIEKRVARCPAERALAAIHSSTAELKNLRPQRSVSN